MKSQLVMMRYCRKEVDVCLNARVSKSTTPFSLMKVARLVRGIFNPLRASGAAGAAATKNGRRAKTVANFICIVKKRLESCGLVKSSGEVRERNELGEPAARVVPIVRSAQVLYVW